MKTLLEELEPKRPKRVKLTDEEIRAMAEEIVGPCPKGAGAGAYEIEVNRVERVIAQRGETPDGTTIATLRDAAERALKPPKRSKQDSIITRLRNGVLDDELREAAANEIARLRVERDFARKCFEAAREELERISTRQEIEALETKLDELKKGKPDGKA